MSPNKDISQKVEISILDMIVPSIDAYDSATPLDMTNKNVNVGTLLSKTVNEEGDELSN